MKSGKSLTDLAAELTRQKDARRDFVADTRELMFSAQENAIHLKGIGDFGVTEHMHRQIGDKLKIPAKYYDRMREEQPQLLNQNVQTWFEQEPERRMIRTLDGNARAFLGERFRALDNFELASAVLPKLQELDATVESCELTETRMYLKAIIPGIQVDIPPEGRDDFEWGEGHHMIDVVKPGIVISNSEIGMGSLNVQPAVHTKACSNLAWFSENRMRKYHVGRVQSNGGNAEDLYEVFTDATKELSERAFWAQIADLVTAALEGDIFEKTVKQLREARGMVIEADPVKAIEVVAEKFSLNDAERGGVLTHLVKGGDLSAYGVSNAVTRMSQDVDDYDRASELEKFGGQIIELKPKEWAVISKAA